VRAIDALDFEVEAGSCVALLGPNGAGKTTTLETVIGLTTPSSGELESPPRERIGVVLQDTRLPLRLTVSEQIALFGSFARDRVAPADELLDLVSLREHADVLTGDLSGGQRQRLAMAVALASDPDLLVLDEPTTGLDPKARRELWAVVEVLRARGKTILLSTHAMDEATRLADRVLFMHEGRIVAAGSVPELIARLPLPRVLELRLDPAPRAEDWTPLGGTVRGDVVRLPAEDVHRALVDVVGRLEQGGVRIVAVASHEGTLDDVYVHLTGRGLGPPREGAS
jgi:ABC-2 type transport system ATP-binding protein